ncbi:hypothetical protein scyTo_0023154 [Scyliorhinus torazame]|uniref:Macro domain-containing protein n=1 Tax=Scyliorhinus torazame TaxID=75743 RepID=A0A401Q849_SCYTO|nr:hypothetical protein [Scyliorhinus torazame]
MKEITQIPSEYKIKSKLAKEYRKQLQNNETLAMEEDEEPVLEPGSTEKTVGLQTSALREQRSEKEQMEILKILHQGGKQIELVAGDFLNAKEIVQVNPSNKEGKLGAGISGILAHKFNLDLQQKIEEEITERGKFREGITRAMVLSRGVKIIHVVSLDNSGQAHTTVDESVINQANMEGILRHSIGRDVDMTLLGDGIFQNDSGESLRACALSPPVRMGQIIRIWRQHWPQVILDTAEQRQQFEQHFRQVLSPLAEIDEIHPSAPDNKENQSPFEDFPGGYRYQYPDLAQYREDNWTSQSKPQKEGAFIDYFSTLRLTAPIAAHTEAQDSLPPGVTDSEEEESRAGIATLPLLVQEEASSSSEDEKIMKPRKRTRNRRNSKPVDIGDYSNFWGQQQPPT